jgi:peptide/nickel transport system permease protein
MLLYVIRRLLQTVPLLLVISALIFLLLYSMPGDPLVQMLQDIPRLRAEDYDRLRKLYGFDDPVYIQYWKWLWQLLQLNPGYSREYGQPVFDIIRPALINTLVLTLSAVVIGKFAAILSAFFRRQAIFHRRLPLTGATFIAYSVPASGWGSC